jgi:hypothetical protein
MNMCKGGRAAVIKKEEHSARRKDRSGFHP